MIVSLLSVQLVFVSWVAAAVDEKLSWSSPLYGLTQVAGSQKSPNLCGEQLKIFQEGIRKEEGWALKMLDSSGIPGTGFLWGNNYWLGIYSQCVRIPIEAELQNSQSLMRPVSHAPFDLSFYIASFTHNSSVQTQVNLKQEDVILIGLCLPSSCTNEDLTPLLESWTNRNPLLIQSIYNFSMSFKNVRLIKEDLSWLKHPSTIGLIIVMGSVFILILSGTAYDVFFWKAKMKSKRNTPALTKKHNGARSVANNRNVFEQLELLNVDNNLNHCYELKIDNSEHKSIPAAGNTTDIATRKLQEQSPVEKLLLCFSLVTNSQTIMSTQIQAEDISAIHGLRFLGMSWIILLHSVFYLRDYADNKPLAFQLAEGFSEQFVSNSTFSVDTFFFIGGFLAAYLYYKNRRGSKTDDKLSVKKKVDEFTFLVIKRFVRLTPVYLVVLGIVNVSMIRSKRTSLFQISELDHETCGKYWWRNILYINNLFRSEEMCMSWSWYLSNDMQFYMIAITLMILSTRFWKFTAMAVGSIIVSSSILIGYLSYVYNYVPTLDQQLALLDVLYYPPWTRVGPYLVGMVTGYFVVQLNGDLIIKKRTRIACWLVAFFCNVWALFGLYKHDPSFISITLYMALSRTTWAIGLSWIVIACCTNNAGFINLFLSHRFWVPLSRLSYSAYLLNPLVITLVYSSSETPMHVDFFPMATYFFGFLGITYFCAFFLSLSFESPVISLIRWATRQRHTINPLNKNLS